MPPAVSRFAHPGQSNPFQHFQQPHLQQHQQSHSQLTNSSGLPPPSQIAHPFSSNPNTNLGSFAANNGLGGPFGGGGGLGGGGGGGGGGIGGPGGGVGLASHAAQMGFAHGAALQQQQAHEGTGPGSSDGKGMAKGRIREVWRGNLAQEMQVLRSLVEKYPYISMVKHPQMNYTLMDTEFPGIVARPMGSFTTKTDYHYQTLRCNVDLLKMIQLGITLFSTEGELPPPHTSDPSGMNGSTYINHLIPCPCTWQFNFRFSLHNDMYAQDSIELLQKCGLDFQAHEKNGIDPFEFGALLMTSGMVLLDDVRWISFHSGYDFGYLMKIMLCRPLPDDESEFSNLLKIFFPSIYDIKFLLKHATRTGVVNTNTPLTPSATQIIQSLGQKGGLQDLAEELSVKRAGTQHQAGSDSLVTGKVFWELRRAVFNGVIDDAQYLGQIWGLHDVAAMASHQQSQQQGGTPNLNGATIYSNGGAPTTPSTSHAGLAGTPGPQTNQGQQGGSGGALGPLTPGGGGGVFGGFQFGKS
ncbi:MAG: hypothetical protein M1827_000455 [Pycnora praestabilis]|nr:MAG: hypothetical protein M1827_000455 [Pycnora praestabilis]